jgi:hypothetical protein
MYQASFSPPQKLYKKIPPSTSKWMEGKWWINGLKSADQQGLVPPAEVLYVLRGVSYLFGDLLIGVAVAKAQPQDDAVAGVVDVFVNDAAHFRIAVFGHEAPPKMKMPPLIPW